MYKRWTIEEIKNVINETGEMWGYPCSLPIEISTRAKTRLGAFFFRKINNNIEGIKFVFAKRLIDGNYSEKIVREVIIHEYLHYYCDTKTGKSNGHNKIFKNMCIKSGISSNATLKDEEKAKDSAISKEKGYYIYCKGCGKLVCIHKRIDAAEQKARYYISNCCKAKLVIKYFSLV